ncbi:SusC/RagA family TonB-linked outer membrane protein [Arcticibacter tournemirensis]|nr:SusC/RagA family TonB-linked outer membrane protein [Arcticibacter tournemirensis]
MKLTVALMLTACLGVQAAGFAQKVNLSLKNAPLKKVFTEIKKQTGYFFLYDDDLLNIAGTVSMDIKNVDLGEALDLTLSKGPLTYQIIDKTVTIIARPLTHTDRKLADIVVKGNVKLKSISGSEESLPGVSVSVKGMHQAVSTDGNGNYSITVREDAVLVFSFIGYEKKEVAVSGRTSINVVLQETVSALNEVVVTGYGTRERKENQVGSATTVTAKDLQMKPVDRIDRLLDGIVPGLQFEVQDNSTSTARPRYQTRIRGEGSISASAEPLWVVDGVPLYTGDETNMISGVQTSVSPLTYLNPNDIESMTVLKDATATAIYGANGSNGVVLITTKKGFAGNNISYNFRTGLSLLKNNRFQVLNGSEYMELFNEAYTNAGSNIAYPFNTENATNTDWYDTFFRNGITIQHNLSLSGGNDKTRYYVSGAYYKEKPIMIENDVQRFSTRINLDQRFSKRVSLSFKLGGSYNTNDLFTPGRDYYSNRPNINPYNADGSYALYDGSRVYPDQGKRLKFFNSLAEAYQNDNNQQAYAINGNIGGTLDILDGLEFTTTNGIDYDAISENIYESMQNWSGYDINGTPVGYMSRSQANSIGWITINRLNFNREFGKHSVSGLMAMEASNSKRSSLYGSAYGFPNDKIRELGYTDDLNERSGGSRSEQSYLSYFSQVNYTFDRRYSFVANYRTDGNSDFGTDVRWARFASAGFSWTISNEGFWKSKVVDFAKFKISYGTNGNARIGAFKSKGIYSFSSSSSYNYNGNYGSIMTSGENPALSWETTYNLNTGVSLSLLKRISMELEFYRDLTKDLLDENVDVSRTTGFTRIARNIGKMENKGIELTLNTKNIETDNFSWSTDLNLAHNHNEIKQLYNNTDKILGNMIHRVGEDVNTYYLIRWAGVDPRDGAALWYDANDNITREFDLNNRVVLGSTTPDLSGGIVNSLRFKQLTLRAQINYTIGGYAFSDFQRDVESDGRNLLSDNQSKNQLDRWKEEGDLAMSPKLILNGNVNTSRNSTRFLHEKTSWRLQNVSLNYKLSKKWLDRLKIAHAGVYIQADNVGFWTPYKTPSDRNDYKNSFNPYPQSLALSFGVDIGFK